VIEVPSLGDPHTPTIANIAIMKANLETSDADALTIAAVLSE